jgi:hypothetical protein
VSGIGLMSVAAPWCMGQPGVASGLDSTFMEFVDALYLTLAAGGVADERPLPKNVT